MRSTLKRSPSIEKIVESKKNDDSKKEADPQLKQKIEVIKRRQSLISEQQKLPSPPPPPPPPAAPLPPPPIPEYLIFPVEFDENDFKRSSIHYAIIGSDITDVKKNLRKVSEPPTNKSCPFLGDSIEECAPEC
ncbi:hypothetical protein TRFO_06036 [Tritrichomonas foetus]|uniref:Uncharacterized protein n=1 Tax=Tritrichomonas foetus TaxID=1144522 RepID=A0A1J4K1D8_9EUKA|nr:hypothetical protein TRFO_06036 [Tritrichomonas foetus]|eukprot:OHT05051.1 hypothetical protein TRFO_06036 [Tritrichomonas foetus]